MKKILLFVVYFSFFGILAYSQCPSCSATAFSFDLSSSIDTSVSISSNRNGNCCTGTNCIRFNIKINPSCSFVNFAVENPAPSGAAYYQINCGPQTSIGTPVCVIGMTDVCITYCKPGNDAPIYTITAAGAIQGSGDITVREGCTDKMGVKGLLTPTITWTSIFPGAAGSFDSYLSCTTACDTINVIPQQGAPAYIDYKVSGSRLCGGIVSDTIRVYTSPQIHVDISPLNPSVCAGGSSSTTLTATASGGDAPYNFVWSGGQTSQSINVNTAATYNISVTDTRGCLPSVQSIMVSETPLPTPPNITSNSPLCAGTNLNLFASTIAGATYSWTGPNGFTSNQQNPIINNVSSANAGIYSVTVIVGSCNSIPASTIITVNAIPPTPLAGSNSPVCEGSSLQLNASLIANALYSWTGPNGFTSFSQNPTVNSVNLINAGLYAVTATVNGCTSNSSTAMVTINPTPVPPIISSNSPVCSGANLNLMASSVAGASYNWTGPNGFISSSQNPTIANVTTNVSGNYYVTATLNGCTGNAAIISIIVNPTPAIPSVSSNSPICEYSNIQLNTSGIANANYTWSGPNGFSSLLQNPAINNATIAAAGTYSATATVNGCTSAASTVVVNVNSIPIAPTVSNNGPVCAGTDILLTASLVSGASYNWTGPNGFNSGLQNPVINNTATTISGTYYVTVTLNGCTSNSSNTNISVKPIPSAPVLSTNSPVCTGNSILLSASSNTNASYSWTGPNGFMANTQNPLISNATFSNAGLYNALVTVNGCTSTASSISVAIDQTPQAPVATNNSSICAGSTLNLSASSIPGASYSWNGPNGFFSAVQNPNIPGATIANGGIYTVTATMTGCTSVPAVTLAVIHKPVTADAGIDQNVCISTNSVNLSGTIAGGSSSGAWTTNGTGTFFPSNASLVNNYIPSVADKNTDSVSLTISSTNNGACPAASAAVKIFFTALPASNAGNDMSVCANNANVNLNGSINDASGGIWKSSGSGSFMPSASSLNATYIPGNADKNNGAVTLTLYTTGSSPCPAASDAMLVKILAAPVLKAGDFTTIENKSITLTPVVNSTGLQFSWTPNIYLSSDKICSPVCTPAADIAYNLTVTDSKGCSSSDEISVKVLKQIQIPNVFTPNADGINDKWQIKNLAMYPGCVVDIYNRYGQSIYHSVGYNEPWDGTLNGKAVPAATYYFIINPKNGLDPLSGFVDIIK